jgi:2,3-bisphosphoglycerate-dependent phosphoglycerate mutase
VAKIIVFRHGETSDNRDHIFSGKRDVDLTENGVKEAEVIAENLKNEKVTKAYYSGQLRSKNTLNIVLRYHPDIIPVLDERIGERDYGDLTGQNKDLVAKENPKAYKLWHRSYDTPPPNGESIKDVEERVVSFLDEVIPTFSKDDVVLISAHGNSLRPIRKYFEGLSNEEMATFEHTPGKIYTYEV